MCIHVIGAPVEEDFKSVNTQTDDTSSRVSPRDQVTSHAPANDSSLQRNLMVAKTKFANYQNNCLILEQQN